MSADDIDTLRDMLTVAGVDRVYGLSEVPSKPIYPYAVLSLAPGAPQVRTLDGSGDRMGRFTVQHFGRSDDSVADLADLTFVAFDGRELPLAGEPVCWQEIATSPYRDPDDRGVLNVLQTYRY